MVCEPVSSFLYVSEHVRVHVCSSGSKPLSGRLPFSCSCYLLVAHPFCIVPLIIVGGACLLSY